jgi:hypothetical protein
VINHDDPAVGKEIADDEIDPDAAFWAQRDELQHVYKFARSRRAAPLATLACVLRRAVGCIEPNVVLEPTIGGVASVNLYTASAGRSGQGKGAADAAGFAAVDFYDIKGNDLDAPRPNPGSGEGLARLFKGRKDEPGLTRAHLSVPEVKTLEALAGRQGSTLISELLKGFMGEPLGFTNSSRETTTAVGAHSYRLCLGVGVQPQNAVFFLSREKDGFPQRFWWVPTIDRYAPEVRPDRVDPIDIVVPDFGSDRYEVPIPPDVRQEIDAHRYRVLIGADDVDPLDGHLMLTRLKVAFALAVLAGRKAVEGDDWKIAGDLISISVQVRYDMRMAVADARRRQNEAKAHDQVDRDTVVSERKMERCKHAVLAQLTKLRDGDHLARNALRKTIRADVRDHFDAAIADLVDTKQIAEISVKQGGSAYTCTPVHPYLTR